MNIKQKDGEYIANTYKRFDLLAVSGDGAAVYDENGKKYLDLAGGIAVNSFGLQDIEWKNAVIGQINKLQHISNYYYTEPQVMLAELICKKTGMKKVFFQNSGAEANECAIKCARKYSRDKYGNGRGTIITLENSFHGRTLATLSATGQPSMHEDFAPMLPGFLHVPANDFPAMEKALSNDTVCAVLLETVQGEGGVIVLDRDYVKKVFELCAARDILFMVDEVQTGNGRTGALFAYMLYGVSPDIFTTAKGLGGGLPIGACVIGEKAAGTLTPGSHGSTFGGNPIVCAGALSILSRIDENLLADIRSKGEFICGSLDGAKGVKSVSGLGLMIGVECEKPSREIAERCLERGLIVLTAHDKVRLLPPLNIDMETLAAALDILKGVIAE